ncbi:Ras-related protein Rab-18 [Halotydeus destructor]|nr:Ras-related protein Rab-18 [Halotydeus destructor]
MADKQCFLKVVVIGEKEVGKTSLLLRMTDNVFFNQLERTRGIELKKVKMNIDDVEVTLNIFDTVGQERHHAVANNYYRYADAALLVYDVNRRDTLEDLEYWASELDMHSKNEVIKVLVGNKLDLVPPKAQPTVKSKISADWAAKRAIGSSLQASAKTGHNVTNAFEAVVRLTTKFQDVAYSKAPQQPEPSTHRLHVNRKKKKSSKCC